MKTCSKCQEVKAVTEFFKDKNRSDGLYPYCKVCKNRDNKVWKQANKEKHNANSRKWRELNGEAHKWILIKSKYGITRDDYDDLLRGQKGLCAVCKQPPGVKGFHIDHDHACCPSKGSCGKCVRGLLCFGCNTGLGLFGDDLERLHQAIAYLQRRS